jgi:uncharacterized damage-inducible protein DinB
MKRFIFAPLMLVVLRAACTLAVEPPAGEYVRHLDALAKLSIDVAQAMPAEKYGFKPHQNSMDFGTLMVHIAVTNYQFCAGLKNSGAPVSSSPAGKEAIIGYLSGSFDYCAEIIAKLDEKDLTAKHNSPDGNLPGWDVLLAMFVHVAHHRGQAEIYLRDNGIAPPLYRV